MNEGFWWVQLILVVLWVHHCVMYIQYSSSWRVCKLDVSAHSAVLLTFHWPCDWLWTNHKIERFCPVQHNMILQITHCTLWMPYDKHVGTAYKHQHVQSLEGSHKAIFDAQWGLKQQVLSYLERYGGSFVGHDKGVVQELLHLLSFLELPKLPCPCCVSKVGQNTNLHQCLTSRANLWWWHGSLPKPCPLPRICWLSAT